MSTKMNSKKAFTIVEVLISVIILATVATLLFQISIKSKNNYIFYKEKQNFENTASLRLLNNIKSNTNIYEIIRSNYKIKELETRKKLKSIKLKQSQKPYSKVKIGEEPDNQITLNITQEQINSKNGSTFYYHIGF